MPPHFGRRFLGTARAAKYHDPAAPAAIEPGEPWLLFTAHAQRFRCDAAAPRHIARCNIFVM